LNFYFNKTANIPVYGNIALSVYTIDYTLRCLEYMCSVSAQLRREDTDKCILTITYMLRFDFFTSETRW